jgi:2-polyprenyl-6-hydroxyphenyl methylase/3-demethylubiquinone-9 3-methyltransferase
LKSFALAIVGAEYMLGLVPRGTHEYAKLIRPGELRAWSALAGLAFMRSASLMFNPLARKFRVAPDREDVNYMASFIRKE